MIIRKLFKFEGAHVVRNCLTDRCMYSIHGHSYKVEVMLTADWLDNGGMIVDFSRVKEHIGRFVDMFDHTTLLWAGDSKEYLSALKRESRRWIEMSHNPSAENIALLLDKVIRSICSRMRVLNGGALLRCVSVRVHETDTGYAETETQDWVNARIVAPSIVEVSDELAPLVVELVRSDTPLR